MKFNSINTKLLLIIIMAFCLSCIGIVLLTDYYFEKIIDKTQSQLYSKEVNEILIQLEGAYLELQDTLMVEHYEEQFKKLVLDSLQGKYYISLELGAFPFIIDGKGAVVMHPQFKRGYKYKALPKHISQIVELKKGSFDYTHEEIKSWVTFDYFEKWDWIVSFTLPFHMKYADSRNFLKVLILITGLITIFVIFLVSAAVTHFIRPITFLTSAASEMAHGNLELRIDNRRQDEIGILAQSFVHMRNSIKEKVDFLNDKNIDLQNEIKDRQRVEKRLRRSEERYRLIAENVADVIWTMDMDLCFTYISPSIFQLRGYTVEEAMQKSLNETLLPGSLEVVMDLLKNKLMLIKSNGNKGWHPVTFEAEQYHKDGSTIWTHNSARFLPGPNKQPVSILGVSRDITDRKHAEEEIKESERRYRTLFEKTTDAIFIVERKTGRYLDANQAAVQLSGRTLPELKKLSTLDVTPVGARERFDTVSTSNRPEDLGEVTYLHPDGTRRVAILTSVPLDDEVIIGVARDITDELEMEDQLRQAQKMEAIGTLAGGIAHDFNNILAAILGYAELALADWPHEDSNRKKLEAIHFAGERARDLVAQILSFSRKNEQIRIPIEIHQILKDALRLIRPAIPATIEIQTQIIEGGFVLGDPSMVHQIFMNLCTNAYQAMQETGGILKISLSQIKMEGNAAALAQVPTGFYVKLTVSDTGFGISSENLERIFDPYFTTKEKGKGTGLGLAAVHGIVKSHGGTIRVQSQIGKGTKFNVYLPLVTDDNVIKEKDEPRLIGGKERILLVDDEHDILKIEKEMLKIQGYSVAEKDNPKEALKLFAEQPEQFDLVITDMTMPNITGDILAGEMIKIRSDIPIILCTGFSEFTSKEKAAAMGINGYLVKPVSRKDLLGMIRKVLDEKKGSIKEDLEKGMSSIR